MRKKRVRCQKIDFWQIEEREKFGFLAPPWQDEPAQQGLDHQEPKVTSLNPDTLIVNSRGTQNYYVISYICFCAMTLAFGDETGILSV